MPDLLAASCLSRRTLERMTRTAYEPAHESLAAMEAAMQFLDPNHPQSIAGWREVLTPKGLADLLDMSEGQAQTYLRGRRTWAEAERATLVRFMMERRTRLAYVPIDHTAAAAT
jgi:hypothetical protein